MKIYLESYGCTLNHGEARQLLRLVRGAGSEQVAEPKQADVIIIFTCTVIETTELKMLRQLRKFSKMGKPVVISGCMAVVQKDGVRNILPEAYFLPPKEIDRIPSMLQEIAGTIGLPTESKPIISGSKSVPLEPGSGTAENAIDSIVPISTGCTGECSYCITRLARGGLLSYSPDKIIREINNALATGHYEVRLTAQDTACYGYDTNEDLAGLLNQIVEINSDHDFRVRVGMMNPDSVKPILPNLINAYNHSRIFKFLHLPVQSGDDVMLKEMNRKYSIKDFLNLVKKFRDEFPGLTLSTDIIVGYPGESDEQFRSSMELIENVQPNIVNITRFSARNGTPAAKLKLLPGSKVKARSRSLTKLRFDISRALNQHELGNKYKVLMTEQIKKGTVLARTDNYQPVVIKDSQPLGNWVDVQVTGATDSYLIGEILG